MSSDRVWTYKFLLLMGGLSSRMGRPNALLKLPNGVSLLERTMEMMRAAGGTNSQIYVSLRNASQLQSMQQELEEWSGCSIKTSSELLRMKILFDEPEIDVGPAAGLISAYELDPESPWIVVGCDYPFLDDKALKQLMSEHLNSPSSVTCFINHEGFVEPLIAVWSPLALSFLKDRVGRGETGLSRAVRELNGNLISPIDDTWLRGVNTPDEWARAFNALA